MNTDTIREKIINGASIHRVAARIIEQVKANTKYYRPVAVAKLAWVYQMGYSNAIAVIEEMDTGANGIDS